MFCFYFFVCFCFFLDNKKQNKKHIKTKNNKKTMPRTSLLHQYPLTTLLPSSIPKTFPSPNPSPFRIAMLPEVWRLRDDHAAANRPRRQRHRQMSTTTSAASSSSSIGAKNIAIRETGFVGGARMEHLGVFRGEGSMGGV